MNQTLEQIGGTLAILIVATGAGVLVYQLLLLIARRLATRTRTIVDDAIIRRCHRPLSIILPATTLYSTLYFIPSRMSELAAELLRTSLQMVFILSFAWLLIKLVYVLEDFLLSQHQLDQTDNLRARKIFTQIQLVKKIFAVMVGVLALSAILMNFDQFRELGAGILASAGLAGIIIGFAAQKTLSNLLAGIQIAVSQPIRIDDVVVVEGEWGWIEEITLTYVVVRIWDLRRLVLPISYFIERPFQNWTRTSADILGTVYLHVDYTVPIEKVRNKLSEILNESDHWDGRVCRLHTTEAGDRTVELRALMSAENSPAAWELRCEVREKLIEYIREQYPQGLPKYRTIVESESDSASPGLFNQEVE